MFKRILSLTLALVVFLGLLPRTAWAEEKMVYLALGDSISAGIALENPETENFPVLVNAQLGEEFGPVRIGAESGETIQSMLQKLENPDYQAAIAQADVISVTIGGNDLMALFYEFLAASMDMTVEEVKLALADGKDLTTLTAAATAINSAENGFAITEDQIAEIMVRFRAMIAGIRTWNPDCALVVATQYNPYQYLTGQVDLYYGFLPAIAPDYVPLADAIRKLSGVMELALSRFNGGLKEDTGYGVADVYSAFHASSDQLCNAALMMQGAAIESVNMDFHPNAVGHRLIAEVMAATIRGELIGGYTVSFRANGGTGEMAAATGIYGSYTLPECGFTPPAGKVFAGWGPSRDGAPFSTPAVEVIMDITLYAIWADCPHSWDQGTVTLPPTEAAPGTRTYTCQLCGATQTEELPALPAPAVKRVSGAGRSETAIAAANAMKLALGVEKFDNMILASGAVFADALTGSYLGVAKKAPILLHYGNSQQVNLPYIQENLAQGGTVYILGGDSAVPQTVEEDLRSAGIPVVRLKGADRFQTNLAILEAAGIGDREIVIASGWVFADSLSLSATGLPVLMVNTTKNILTEEQIAFLAAHKDHKITIAGGTAAVSPELEAEIEAIVGKDVTRVSGSGREATSVAIAQAYFEAPSFAVAAYSRNFPDGLSGGPLAYFLNAPMLLVEAGKEEYAKDYVNQTGIRCGYIMGGTAALTDATARAVFSLAEDAGIPGF